MKFKKLGIAITVVMLMNPIFQGCKYNDIDKESIKVNLFNSKDAVLVGSKYLQYIIEDNYEEANNLCLNELLKDNQNINEGSSKIIAFKPDSIIESGSSAYGIFNVIRKSENEPKSDLDSYSIKIVKENDEYKISEIKAVNKQQIFTRGNALRILGEDGGKSELIVRLSNMPKDVYKKENSVMIYKEAAPNDSFGIVSASYTGRKIALSTIGDGKTFVALGILEPDLAVGPAQEASETIESLEEALEKPIIKKLIPMDLLEGITLTDFIFSQEEEDIVIQYISKDGSNRINVYNTSDGALIPIEFDKIFPQNKYNIILKALEKNTLIITVSPYSQGAEDELIGEYKVDMETLNITKSEDI